MPLTRLSINHYKTVEEPMTIDRFSHLHILIGPNNAGKTNIMDAIEFLLYPGRDPARLFDPCADVSCDIEDSGRTIHIQHIRGTHQFFIDGAEFSPDDARVKELQKRCVRILPDITPHEVITNGLTRMKEEYAGAYGEFCRALSHYFDDMEVSEQLFLQTVHTDRRDRPIARMGEGFKRLFVMLFYIFNPVYPLILIDEPELHVHPSMVKKFVRVLLDVKRNNQIFLTTHHSVFVEPYTLPYLWRVARDVHRNTKVHSLATAGLAPHADRFVQEINADNAEMFFADKVLLVEGVSDRILMRGLIDRFYTGDHDVKVVYAGSKGNVDVYAELCRAFHISYVVMLDRDALHGAWPHIISDALHGHHRSAQDEQIRILKEHNIFILDGDLESSYPKKYQKRDTKPLNALHASQNITGEDVHSSVMKGICEVIEHL